MLARPSSSSYVLIDDVRSRLRAVEELGFVNRDSLSLVENGRALIVWAGERLSATLGPRAGDQTVGMVPPSST